MRNTERGIKSRVFRTPLGWAAVAVSDRGVAQVVLPKKSRKAAERELGNAEKSSAKAAQRRIPLKKTEAVLTQASRKLQRYFSGKPVVFDLPLDISYYTAFQQSVWRAATEIPCRETRSYAWIAKKTGRGNAARAAGQALGANPVPILIP
jgi:methylated-DNA-[protein]-cysteine S-methyltransferase